MTGGRKRDHARTHRPEAPPERDRDLTPLPEPEESAEGHRYPEAPVQYTVPDRDYVADLEQSDSQIRKRMDQRLRGKPVKPPREPR